MATVFIPAQLQNLTGAVGKVDISATTIRELVDQLESQHPGIKDRLCKDDELSPNLQVSIDGVMSNRGLRAKLTPDSEVHFLPAIGGG